MTTPLLRVVAAFVLVVGLGACSGDPTQSEEYLELEQRLERVTNERDALRIEVGTLGEELQPGMVRVTLSGVTGHAGDDLAGVLYPGDEVTLVDLDRAGLGGFATSVSGNAFAAVELVRAAGAPHEGRFPFVTDAPLVVEPGNYTLVVWVDTSLGAARRWVPVNTDGRGLFGCRTTFEVGPNAPTDVTVSVGLQPDGWNVDCETGAVSDDVTVAGDPGTVTVNLTDMDGLEGLVVQAWVLPLEPTERFQTLGGTHLESGSGVVHPTADRYWDWVMIPVAVFDPGTYRLSIEAWVDSGPMRFGCEQSIEVVEGEALEVTVPWLPEYTGDGVHWTPTAELVYPECPE
jgi:hypothetical protein